MIKITLLICVVMKVSQTQALVQLRTSLTSSDNPLLTKILQSIDAATSDEHLFEVTIKLLKSLCLCMRDTLKAKEKTYNSAKSLVGLTKSVSTEGKVLELYKKIYNNTCFNLKRDLAKRTNVSSENWSHSNCGKHKENITSKTGDDLQTVKNVLRSKLDHILYRALVQTRQHHKYNIKKYNLFGKAKNKVKSSPKHTLIVILTLYPARKDLKKYNVVEEDLHKVLHKNNPIDIDIIDTRYDQKEKESEEAVKPGVYSDCHLQSLYTYLAESEKKNLTKVFRFLRRRDTIKIYIEVFTGRNHTDYINICCENGSISELCKKELIENLSSQEDITVNYKAIDNQKSMLLKNNFKNTISKLKDLVKRLDAKAYNYSTTDLTETINSKFNIDTTENRINEDLHKSSPTVKENDNFTEKLDFRPNSVPSFVGNLTHPYKLKDVSRAIILLNNFVSKQTTLNLTNTNQTDYTQKPMSSTLGLTEFSYTESNSMNANILSSATSKSVLFEYRTAISTTEAESILDTINMITVAEQNNDDLDVNLTFHDSDASELRNFSTKTYSTTPATAYTPVMNNNHGSYYEPMDRDTIITGNIINNEVTPSTEKNTDIKGTDTNTQSISTNQSSSISKEIINQFTVNSNSTTERQSSKYTEYRNLNHYIYSNSDKSDITEKSSTRDLNVSATNDVHFASPIRVQNQTEDFSAMTNSYTQQELRLNKQVEGSHLTKTHNQSLSELTSPNNNLIKKYLDVKQSTQNHKAFQLKNNHPAEVIYKNNTKFLGDINKKERKNSHKRKKNLHTKSSKWSQIFQPPSSSKFNNTTLLFNTRHKQKRKHKKKVTASHISPKHSKHNYNSFFTTINVTVSSGQPILTSDILQIKVKSIFSNKMSNSTERSSTPTIINNEIKEQEKFAIATDSKVAYITYETGKNSDILTAPQVSNKQTSSRWINDADKLRFHRSSLTPTLLMSTKSKIYGNNYLNTPGTNDQEVPYITYQRVKTSDIISTQVTSKETSPRILLQTSNKKTNADDGLTSPIAAKEEIPFITYLTGSHSGILTTQATSKDTAPRASQIRTTNKTYGNDRPMPLKTYKADVNSDTSSIQQVSNMRTSMKLTNTVDHRTLHSSSLTPTLIMTNNSKTDGSEASNTSIATKQEIPFITYKTASFDILTTTISSKETSPHNLVQSTKNKTNGNNALNVPIAAEQDISFITYVTGANSDILTRTVPSKVTSPQSMLMTIKNNTNGNDALNAPIAAGQAIPYLTYMTGANSDILTTQVYSQRTSPRNLLQTTENKAYSNDALNDPIVIEQEIPFILYETVTKSNNLTPQISHKKTSTDVIHSDENGVFYGASPTHTLPSTNVMTKSESRSSDALNMIAFTATKSYDQSQTVHSNKNTNQEKKERKTTQRHRNILENTIDMRNLEEGDSTLENNVQPNYLTVTSIGTLLPVTKSLNVLEKFNSKELDNRQYFFSTSEVNSQFEVRTTFDLKNPSNVKTTLDKIEPIQLPNSPYVSITPMYKTEKFLSIPENKSHAKVSDIHNKNNDENLYTIYETESAKDEIEQISMPAIELKTELGESKIVDAPKENLVAPMTEPYKEVTKVTDNPGSLIYTVDYRDRDLVENTINFNEKYEDQIEHAIPTSEYNIKDIQLNDLNIFQHTKSIESTTKLIASTKTTYNKEYSTRLIPRRERINKSSTGLESPIDKKEFTYPSTKALRHTQTNPTNFILKTIFTFPENTVFSITSMNEKLSTDINRPNIKSNNNNMLNIGNQTHLQKNVTIQSTRNDRPLTYKQFKTKATLFKEPDDLHEIEKNARAKTTKKILNVLTTNIVFNNVERTTKMFLPLSDDISNSKNLNQTQNVTIIFAENPNIHQNILKEKKTVYTDFPKTKIYQIYRNKVSPPLLVRGSTDPVESYVIQYSNFKEPISSKSKVTKDINEENLLLKITEKEVTTKIPEHRVTYFFNHTTPIQNVITDTTTSKMTQFNKTPIEIYDNIPTINLSITKYFKNKPRKSVTRNKETHVKIKTTPSNAIKSNRHNMKSTRYIESPGAVTEVKDVEVSSTTKYDKPYMENEEDATLKMHAASTKTSATKANIIKPIVHITVSDFGNLHHSPTESLKRKLVNTKLKPNIIENTVTPSIVIDLNENKDASKMRNDVTSGAIKKYVLNEIEETTQKSDLDLKNDNMSTKIVNVTKMDKNITSANMSELQKISTRSTDIDNKLLLTSNNMLRPNSKSIKDSENIISNKMFSTVTTELKTDKIVSRPIIDIDSSTIWLSTRYSANHSEINITNNIQNTVNNQMDNSGITIKVSPSIVTDLNENKDASKMRNDVTSGAIKKYVLNEIEETTQKSDLDLKNDNMSTKIVNVTKMDKNITSANMSELQKISTRSTDIDNKLLLTSNKMLRPNSKSIKDSKNIISNKMFSTVTTEPKTDKIVSQPIIDIDSSTMWLSTRYSANHSKINITNNIQNTVNNQMDNSGITIKTFHTIINYPTSFENNTTFRSTKFVEPKKPVPAKMSKAYIVHPTGGKHYVANTFNKNNSTETSRMAPKYNKARSLSTVRYHPKQTGTLMSVKLNTAATKTSGVEIPSTIFISNKYNENVFNDERYHTGNTKEKSKISNTVSDTRESTLSITNTTSKYNKTLYTSKDIHPTYSLDTKSLKRSTENIISKNRPTKVATISTTPVLRNIEEIFNSTSNNIFAETYYSSEKPRITNVSRAMWTTTNDENNTHNFRDSTINIPIMTSIITTSEPFASIVKHKNNGAFQLPFEILEDDTSKYGTLPYQDRAKILKSKAGNIEDIKIRLDVGDNSYMKESKSKKTNTVSSMRILTYTSKRVNDISSSELHSTVPLSGAVTVHNSIEDVGYIFRPMNDKDHVRKSKHTSAYTNGKLYNTKPLFESILKNLSTKTLSTISTHFPKTVYKFNHKIMSPGAIKHNYLKTNISRNSLYFSTTKPTFSIGFISPTSGTTLPYTQSDVKDTIMTDFNIIPKTENIKLPIAILNTEKYDDTHFPKTVYKFNHKIMSPGAIKHNYLKTNISRNSLYFSTTKPTFSIGFISPTSGTTLPYTQSDVKDTIMTDFNIIPKTENIKLPIAILNSEKYDDSDINNVEFTSKATDVLSETIKIKEDTGVISDDTFNYALYTSTTLLPKTQLNILIDKDTEFYKKIYPMNNEILATHSLITESNQNKINSNGGKSKVIDSVALNRSPKYTLKKRKDTKLPKSYGHTGKLPEMLTMKSTQKFKSKNKKITSYTESYDAGFEKKTLKISSTKHSATNFITIINKDNVDYIKQTNISSKEPSTQAVITTNSIVDDALPNQIWTNMADITTSTGSTSINRGKQAKHNKKHKTQDTLNDTSVTKAGTIISNDNILTYPLFTTNILPQKALLNLTKDEYKTAFPVNNEMIATYFVNSHDMKNNTGSNGTIKLLSDLLTLKSTPKSTLKAKNYVMSTGSYHAGSKEKTVKELSTKRSATNFTEFFYNEYAKDISEHQNKSTKKPRRHDAKAFFNNRKDTFSHHWSTQMKNMSTFKAPLPIHHEMLAKHKTENNKIQTTRKPLHQEQNFTDAIYDTTRFITNTSEKAVYKNIDNINKINSTEIIDENFENSSSRLRANETDNNKVRNSIKNEDSLHKNTIYTTVNKESTQPIYNNEVTENTVFDTTPDTDMRPYLENIMGTEIYTKHTDAIYTDERYQPTSSVSQNLNDFSTNGLKNFKRQDIVKNITDLHDNLLITVHSSTTTTTTSADVTYADSSKTNITKYGEFGDKIINNTQYSVPHTRNSLLQYSQDFKNELRTNKSPAFLNQLSILKYVPNTIQRSFGKKSSKSDHLQNTVLNGYKSAKPRTVKSTVGFDEQYKKMPQLRNKAILKTIPTQTQSISEYILHNNTTKAASKKQIIPEANMLFTNFVQTEPYTKSVSSTVNNITRNTKAPVYYATLGLKNNVTQIKEPVFTHTQTLLRDPHYKHVTTIINDKGNKEILKFKKKSLLKSFKTQSQRISEDILHNNTIITTSSKQITRKENISFMNFVPTKPYADWASRSVSNITGNTKQPVYYTTLGTKNNLTQIKEPYTHTLLRDPHYGNISPNIYDESKKEILKFKKKPLLKSFKTQSQSISEDILNVKSSTNPLPRSLESLKYNHVNKTKTTPEEKITTRHSILFTNLISTKPYAASASNSVINIISNTKTLGTINNRTQIKEPVFTTQTLLRDPHYKNITTIIYDEGYKEILKFIKKPLKSLTTQSHSISEDILHNNTIKVASGNQITPKENISFMNIVPTMSYADRASRPFINITSNTKPPAFTQKSNLLGNPNYINMNTPFKTTQEYKKLSTVKNKINSIKNGTLQAIKNEFNYVSMNPFLNWTNKSSKKPPHFHRNDEIKSWLDHLSHATVGNTKLKSMSISERTTNEIKLFPVLPKTEDKGKHLFLTAALDFNPKTSLNPYLLYPNSDEYIRKQTTTRKAKNHQLYSRKRITAKPYAANFTTKQYEEVPRPVHGQINESKSHHNKMIASNISPHETFHSKHIVLKHVVQITPLDNKSTTKTEPIIKLTERNDTQSLVKRNYIANPILHPNKTQKIKSRLSTTVKPDALELSIRVGIETNKDRIQFSLLSIDENPTNFSQNDNNKLDSSKILRAPGTLNNQSRLDNDAKHFKRNNLYYAKLPAMNLTRRLNDGGEAKENHTVLNNSTPANLSSSSKYKPIAVTENSLDYTFSNLTTQKPAATNGSNTSLTLVPTTIIGSESKPQTLNSKPTVKPLKLHKKIFIKPAALTEPLSVDSLKQIFQEHSKRNNTEIETLKNINETLTEIKPEYVNKMELEYNTSKESLFQENKSEEDNSMFVPFNDLKQERSNTISINRTTMYTTKSHTYFTNNSQYRMTKTLLHNNHNLHINTENEKQTFDTAPSNIKTTIYDGDDLDQNTQKDYQNVIKTPTISEEVADSTIKFKKIKNKRRKSLINAFKYKHDIANVLKDLVKSKKLGRKLFKSNSNFISSSPYKFRKPLKSDSNALFQQLLSKIRKPLKSRAKNKIIRHLSSKIRKPTIHLNKTHKLKATSAANDKTNFDDRLSKRIKTQIEKPTRKSYFSPDNRILPTYNETQTEQNNLLVITSLFILKETTTQPVITSYHFWSINSDKLSSTASPKFSSQSLENVTLILPNPDDQVNFTDRPTEIVTSEPTFYNYTSVSPLYSNIISSVFKQMELTKINSTSGNYKQESGHYTSLSTPKAEPTAKKHVITIKIRVPYVHMTTKNTSEETNKTDESSELTISEINSSSPSVLKAQDLQHLTAITLLNNIVHPNINVKNNVITSNDTSTIFNILEPLANYKQNIKALLDSNVTNQYVPQEKSFTYLKSPVSMSKTPNWSLNDIAKIISSKANDSFVQATEKTNTDQPQAYLPIANTTYSSTTTNKMNVNLSNFSNITSNTENFLNGNGINKIERYSSKNKLYETSESATKDNQVEAEMYTDGLETTITSNKSNSSDAITELDTKFSSALLEGTPQLTVDYTTQNTHITSKEVEDRKQNNSIYTPGTEVSPLLTIDYATQRTIPHIISKGIEDTKINNSTYSTTSILQESVTSDKAKKMNVLATTTVSSHTIEYKLIKLNTTDEPYLNYGSSTASTSKITPFIEIKYNKEATLHPTELKMITTSTSTEPATYIIKSESMGTNTTNNLLNVNTSTEGSINISNFKIFIQNVTEMQTDTEATTLKYTQTVIFQNDDIKNGTSNSEQWTTKQSVILPLDISHNQKSLDTIPHISVTSTREESDQTSHLLVKPIDTISKNHIISRIYILDPKSSKSIWNRHTKENTRFAENNTKIYENQKENESFTSAYTISRKDNQRDSSDLKYQNSQYVTLASNTTELNKSDSKKIQIQNISKRKFTDIVMSKLKSALLKNSEQLYLNTTLKENQLQYGKEDLQNEMTKNYTVTNSSNRTKLRQIIPRLKKLNSTKIEPTVTNWWLDDMYLKVRLPLPINSNPGMVFPRRHFAKMEEVADLGALFIDDILDYKEMLDRGELPLERATSREKGQPLCMEQFYRLLGVCRIPEVGKDRLELPLVKSGNEEQEELVVVACRNYFYPIPVKAADRGRITPGEIQAQLLHAMVDAAGAPPAPRIGLLTSMNRDQWAKAREHLVKDEMNHMNLELISRALCILCLDEAGGDRADTDPETNAMLRAMHGAGTRHHSANRWFDKTVQLIISSDGTVGMCYEHSAAEGVAVVRLAERALARAEVADRPAPPPALLPAPQAMKWHIVPDVQRTIEQAARDLDRAISDLDFKVYTYRGYGREFMKSCRTSPDVYIQLAIQYAYYKMYGYLVTTYESASLRRFRQGRVDNIRSAHGAALAWAAAMCTAEASPLNDETDEGQKKVSFNLYGEQKKLELFEEAARKQTSIMEANILGKGIDNHLLGLREMARETMGELPPVFCDTAYKQMFEFKMSTSQVATTTDGTFMGYGAVCPDGYGCCYNPKKDSIIFCISSFSSSSVTNTEAYRQSLEEALDSMKLMFQARKVDN